MITFLIVYKHNASVSEYKNIQYISDGVPSLSDIQLKIMNKNNWKMNDFAIINIIPVKTELADYE